MKTYFSIFLAGFIQVILVCLNTYQIASYVKEPVTPTLLGIVGIGFLISFIWTWNVKKVVFGGIWDRVSYALGAAIGSAVGVTIGNLIY